MESVKLRTFKGLYTNIDESDGDPEFFRDCKDVKIRPGQIISDSMSEEEITGLIGDDDGEVLYFGTVYLDNDKNANRFDTTGLLVSDYKRNIQSYYLIITYYNNKTFVRLYNNLKSLVYESSPYLDKFKNIKTINSEGIVKILTNDQLYTLQRISRSYHLFPYEEREGIIKSVSNTYPTTIETLIDHNLHTGDEVEISGWEGTLKKTEFSWDILEIPNYYDPALIKIVPNINFYFQFKTGVKIRIDGWQGVPSPGYPGLNGEWDIIEEPLNYTSFRVQTRIYSTTQLGRIYWKDTNYNGPVPKSLNGRWIVTVIDDKKFQVNNCVESTLLNGKFKKIGASGDDVTNKFIFENQFIDNPLINILTEIVSKGYASDEQVVITMLDNSLNKQFVRPDNGETATRTFPYYEFNFSIKHSDGTIEGIDFSDIPLLSIYPELMPDKNGRMAGNYVFPQSYDKQVDIGVYQYIPALVMPENFTEHITIRSGNIVPDLAFEKINNALIKNQFTATNPTSYNAIPKYSYMVNPNTLVLKDLVYTGNMDVANSGFINKTGKGYLIGTYILDYKDEVIFYKNELNISSNIPSYALKVSFSVLDEFKNLNKRITAMAFYFKTKPVDDYQQIKYLNLCAGAAPSFSFLVNQNTPNGIFLNQTIGVMYDTNRYKLITSVQDYKVVSGIPFIISNGNLVAGAIGSGNAMNIFYEQNIVPDVSDLNLTQLVDINGTLGAADESSISLISVNNTEGVLLFSSKGQMSYGVSDADHIVELAEGTVFYTKQGIYITDGYEQKLISQQINDIIESSYPNGWVEYDSINEELYYCNGVKLFKYNNLYSYWTEVTYYGGRYRIDDDGNMLLFKSTDTGSKLFKMAPGDGFGYLKTMNMDLGYPNIAKALTSIVLDFQGTITVDGDSYESSTRSMIVKSLRLVRKDRARKEVRPNVLRFGTDMTFKGIIYGITLNYEIQGVVQQSKIYSNI